MESLRKVTIILIFMWTAASAHAAVIHDENLDGDLSNDHASPTTLFISNGSNKLTGTVGADSDNIDYFSFTVSSIDTVDIVVDNWAGSSINTPLTIWTSIVFGDGLEILFNADDIGNTLITFSEGTYIFLLNENTFFGAHEYALDFQVSSVPVPAAIWLFGSGLLGIIGVSRNRKV